ncbi:MAG: hypothetical protein Q8S33_00935 [Myxococcales bacterium]|nr:hypothetical protein [Myxococcales bacterium]
MRTTPVHVSGLVWVMTVISCAHASKHLEMGLAGDIPLAVTNLTSAPIIGITVRTTEPGPYDGAVMIFDGAYGRPVPIAPGQTAWYSFKAGRYGISMQGSVSKDRFPVALFRDDSFTLGKATHLIIHEDPKPPTDAAPISGFAVELRERTDRVEQRQAQAQSTAKQARQSAVLASCQDRIGPDVAPAPGKTKATGKWRCVLGGGGVGTDNVDLVQLADGHIAATVSGSDRNTTWSGVVSGNKVHFRFEGVAAAGGTLKLDPSGRAMIGEGHTFDGSVCRDWTLTCTR